MSKQVSECKKQLQPDNCPHLFQHSTLQGGKHARTNYWASKNSGSKSFDVGSLPKLGPYENNSIHPIAAARAKLLSANMCLSRFRMQNNSNLTTVRISSSILLSKEGSTQEQTTGQARTQDQSLLMLDHCQSSDLMRIVQFILLQQPVQNFYQRTCVPSRFQNAKQLQPDNCPHLF